jgi:mRNA interferase MazF
VGSEIRKIRPAVVINRDSIGRLPLRLVVPITDWKSRYDAFHWFTFLPADATNGLTKDSGADAFQVKSVALSRFVQRIGVASQSQLNAIATTIAICVDAP